MQQQDFLPGICGILAALWMKKSQSLKAHHLFLKQ